MVWLYAVALVVGLVLLTAWILAHAHAKNEGKARLDPEIGIGIRGRRVVTSLVAFGMAGLSAEFSPRDIPWQASLVLALLAAAVLQWWVAHQPVESD